MLCVRIHGNPPVCVRLPVPWSPGTHCPGSLLPAQPLPELILPAVLH